MESPFSDFISSEDPRKEEHLFPEMLLLESPFVDVDFAKGEIDARIDSDRLISDEVYTVGDATLTVSDGTKSSLEEFREPVPSGNPLLVVTAGDRKLKISANFTVGEYARAQSGKHKFDLIRVDPVLVDNLQRLRTFLGKSVGIVDGYYTVRYLRDVLRITDARRISLNPHITGRAVKIKVDGYHGMIKQLAIAAIVSCDRDINLGIGESTMTVYVKQGLTKPVDTQPEDFQRIVSYISNEKTRVAAYTFCVDIKRILYTHKDIYEKAMKKAVSAFAAIMLKVYYKQGIPVEWMDWEKPLGDVISLMHNKSITQDPNVILYCIAYSAFGNLYRNFLKSKDQKQAIDYMVNVLTSDNDRTNRNSRGSFLFMLNESDKTGFIDNCRQRILVGQRSDGSRYHLAPETFFDWKDHPQDKIFKDKLSEFIKKVYFANRYAYDIPAQQSPVGGTRRSMEKSPANPDKPVIDFTGRYVAQFDASHPTLYGRYVVINQAGNYISGKMGGIYKLPVKDLRKTITEFYGKIDDKGNAICPVFPQQTLILKKVQDQFRLYMIDNPSDKFLLNVPLVSLSKRPVISNLILNSFARSGFRNMDLMLTLAWIHPLPDQLKAFLDSFRVREPDLKAAITGYFNSNETVPSRKRTELRHFVSELDTSIDNYLKLPPMFGAFAQYYIKFVYSNAPHWSPRNDKETRSWMDWIRKMLEDYRDFQGTADVEKDHGRLYAYLDVDTKIPDILYGYQIKIKVSAFGIGPFARSSGTITISNKTDYKKYPAAQKWSEENFDIVLWNATLSLNPLKWTPKIAMGQSIEASILTSAFYSASDFSGAEVQVTEGKLFELPLGVDSGGVKIKTKAGIGGVVVLIDGHGKKTLEFSSDLELSLPDSIEIEPNVSDAHEGTYEKIAEMLPSLTMYTGYIKTKKTGTDISSVPLPDQFASSYQLKDTRFFMHDNPVLTAQAIEATGRLCAEELVAFSDPSSEVEIYGHADASGDPKHNLELSLVRALNVRQAIEDRLGSKLRAKIKTVKGLGESDANKVFGEYTEKNAWLRRVVVIINGRAVLSLGE